MVLLYLQFPQSYGAVQERLGFPANRDETTDYYQIEGDKPMGFNLVRRRAALPRPQGLHRWLSVQQVIDRGSESGVSYESTFVFNGSNRAGFGFLRCDARR
jgi:hypothetical protein